MRESTNNYGPGKLGLFSLEKPRWGDTLLEKAIQNGYAECVEVLLKHGVPIHCFRDNTDNSTITGRNADDHLVGEGPMHLAVRFHQTEIIFILLLHSGNPDCPHGNMQSRTPLYDIARSGGAHSFDIAKILVYFGASLMTDPSGLFNTIICCCNVSEKLEFFIGVGCQFDTPPGSLLIYFKMKPHIFDSKTPDTVEDIRELLRQIGIVYTTKKNKKKEPAAVGDKQASEIADKSEQTSNLDQDQSRDSEIDPWTASGQMNLQERCRLVIRECLISNSQGKFILPQLQKLNLPDRLKQYVSFDTYLEYVGFNASYLEYLDLMASLNNHSNTAVENTK